MIALLGKRAFVALLIFCLCTVHYSLFAPPLSFALCIYSFLACIVLQVIFIFNVNPCSDKYIKMSRPLNFFSQSYYLILAVDINSHTYRQAVQIQISWLLQKPTDFDVHCLQRHGIFGFRRTRVNVFEFYNHCRCVFLDD